MVCYNVLWGIFPDWVILLVSVFVSVCVVFSGTCVLVCECLFGIVCERGTVMCPTLVWEEASFTPVCWEHL